MTPRAPSSSTTALPAPRTAARKPSLRSTTSRARYACPGWGQAFAWPQPAHLRSVQTPQQVQSSVDMEHAMRSAKSVRVILTLLGALSLVAGITVVGFAGTPKPSYTLSIPANTVNQPTTIAD